MAINKDKVRAAAQKFLQKGQLDKAIREFQRIVEDDPKDVRTLLKVGDLQTRKGDHGDATTTYTRVAAFYSEQGFYLKAVAVYKQILKIDPTLIDVSLKLAELYHQLGLLSDATNQYRQICQLFEQSGKIDECISVLGKMVELDPENVASRIKLAELFAKQGMLEEARADFKKAAHFLKSQQRIDDYIKVAERMVFFDPADLKTTRELANIYIQKSDARRALAKLQICFKADPTDMETLNLLAGAFRELGQVQKTVSVYKEIARLHRQEGREDAFLSVMRKIQDLAPNDGDAAEALEQETEPKPQALARIIPAKRPTNGPPPVREVDAQDSGQQPAQPPALQAPKPSEEDIGEPGAEVEIDADDLDIDLDDSFDVDLDDDVPAQAPLASEAEVQDAVHRLMVETDIYIKYGLRDKAIEHIRKIFAIAPNHRDAQEKHKDLLLEAGDTRAAVEALWRMVDQALAADQNDAAQDALEEILGIEPSASRARALLAEIAPHAAALGAVLSDDEADDLEHTIGNSDPVPSVALEGGVSPSNISYEPSPLAADFNLDDDLEELPENFTANSTDLSEEFLLDQSYAESGDLVGAHTDNNDEILAAAIEDDEAATLDAPDISSSTAKEPQPAPLPKPAAANRPANMTGIDDLDALLASAVPKKSPKAAQSVDDAPIDVAASAAPELSFEADVIDEAQELLDAEPATPEENATIAPGPSIETAEVVQPDDVDEPATAASDPALEAYPDLEDEIDEVGFYLEQGLSDEAQEGLANLLAQYPDHPELLALKERLLPPAERVLESEAQHDANERYNGGDDGDDEPEPEAMVVANTDLASTLAEDFAEAEDGDYQASFADVFDEFKRGVAEQVDESDHATHYDLGIAYKEMGLLEDAIRELHLAKTDPGRTIGALTLIGLCELQLGNNDNALSSFLEGLNSDDVTPQQAMALRFEIGQAYEAAGHNADAAKFYAKVHTMDDTFRDVARRLHLTQNNAASAPTASTDFDELLEETPNEQAARDQGEDDKISYL